MTRLQKQILKEEQKLKDLKDFAATKQELFNNDLPKIEKILWQYGIKVISKDNCFVEQSITTDKFIFRMYLGIERTKKLSERREDNLIAKLREFKITMPICPMSQDSLHLVYRD